MTRNMDSSREDTKFFYLSVCDVSPHGNGLERMLGSAAYYQLLAFGNPGFASDEHPSSSQP